MDGVTVTEARSTLGELVSEASFKGVRTTIRRHGKPVAVLVSAQDAELLEQLEDRLDLAAARKAMKEGGPSIPWEKVKKDLGL